MQLVYLVKGNDPSLLDQAVSRLVDDLVGARDRGMTVQEMSVDADVSTVLDACQTPALLSDRRVVVVSDAGRFKTGEIEPLITYLKSPMPTTSLVLVGGGGIVATRLVKAVKEHGHLIDASMPTGKARNIWISEQLKQAPVQLDRSAVELVTQRLGEELGLLTGLLDALAAAYGQDARVNAAQVEPYLGVNGIGAPWELTDAIDKGDTATALAQLRRMLDGGRHPLVVMATLQRHFTSLLRLDGASVHTEQEAAAMLGISVYPARKALAQARAAGSMSIARGTELIAQADIDLRGASAWPSEMVLELLVARLSRLKSVSTRTKRRVST